MAVITKTKDLLEHTFVMTAKTERFPKKYRQSIALRLENYTIDIYEALVEANELNLADYNERKERIRLQTRVLVLCKLLNTLIELAHKTPSIDVSISAAEYWSGLVVEVKRMTAVWRRHDKEPKRST